MSSPADKHLAKGKLKSKAARGGAATVAIEVFRTAGRTASTMVLARLLTPADFGVVAIVTGYVLLLEGIADGGLSAAAIRERKLSAQQSSNLFWCNLVLNVAISIVSIAGAPLLARFVGEPEVVRFVPLATLAMLFRGLGAQQRVLLQRNLEFGSIARAEATGVVLNATVAIGLAAAGLGIWSILLANAVSSAVVTAMRWTVSGWRPGGFRKGHETRRLLRRGAGLLASATINSIRNSADSVILARFAGAAEVGLYSKAYGLLMMPMSRMLMPMNRVALPILVQLWDDPERFRKAYFRLVSFLGLVTTPLTAFLFIGAEDLVAIMLGPQFKAAVPIFRVLALASLGMSTAASANWVQQASGRVKRQVGISAITAACTITANVVGAWLGGAMGMAIGWVVAIQLSRHPNSWICLRGSPVPFRSFLSAAVPGTVVAIVGFAAMCVPAFLLATPGGPIARLGLTWSIGIAAMAATALLWPRLRRDVHEAIDMIRAVRKTPRSPRQRIAEAEAAAEAPTEPST